MGTLVPKTCEEDESHDPSNYCESCSTCHECAESAIERSALEDSAPKMYEILKMLLGFNCPSEYITQDEEEALSSIEGLLKKARGES